MSVLSGSSAHFHTLDQHTRDQIMAHQSKVVAALSHHSDPTLRQIGRLLASSTLTPRQLIDDPRHAARSMLKPGGGWPTDRAGATREDEAGPASRPNFTDPDNGAGGVPAIRR
jgi:hypothetical protein